MDKRSLGLHELESLKKYTSIPNPAYVDAIRLDLIVRVPRVLKYYKDVGGRLHVPIGAVPGVLRILGPSWNIIDDRNEHTLDIDYDLGFDFRDYQSAVMKTTENRTRIRT